MFPGVVSCNKHMTQPPSHVTPAHSNKSNFRRIACSLCDRVFGPFDVSSSNSWIRFKTDFDVVATAAAVFLLFLHNFCFEFELGRRNRFVYRAIVDGSSGQP